MRAAPDRPESSAGRRVRGHPELVPEQQPRSPTAAAARARPVVAHDLLSSSRKLSGTPGETCSVSAAPAARPRPPRRRATSSGAGLEGLDLLGDELDLARLLVVDPAAHDHDPVDVDLVRVGGVGGVEDEHLDLALEVVERGEHHRVALPRADPLALGDHAADGDPLAVLLRRPGRRASSPPSPAAPGAPP